MASQPQAPNNLKLEDQLCFPLYAATHALIKLYYPFLRRLKLTYPQYLVMLALWQNNGLMVTDIGRLLRLDTGTLTPLLKRLEAMKLVERHRPQDDKRRVVIFLTKKGAALHEEAKYEKLPLLGEEEVVGCADKDLAQLRKDIYRLLDRIDRIFEERKQRP
ncbi:MAG: MarR family transcriptional regulator [Proteobacteria bacterium]|nr:MarR family transcriptional regulator [Pseudomonadota bacterium]